MLSNFATIKCHLRFRLSMLSKNKLSENKTMQLKLCNNKMPFSLPIINVERKQVEQKTKLCNQNYATIKFHLRFRLLMLSKNKLCKNQILQQNFAIIKCHSRFRLFMLSKNKLCKNQNFATKVCNN